MGIIIFFLIFAVILESGITTLPLSLLILIFAGIVTRNNNIFLIAFFTGLVLDFFSARTIGLTSAYFISFIFLIFLYQKKFEIQTLHFIIISSFFGAIGYLILTGVNSFIIQSVFATILSSFSFFIFSIFNTKKLKYN